MGTRPRRTAELLVQETGSNDGEQSCIRHSPLCASSVRVSRVVALHHASRGKLACKQSSRTDPPSGLACVPTPTPVPVKLSPNMLLCLVRKAAKIGRGQKSHVANLADS
jgi:hypothetical protein